MIFGAITNSWKGQLVTQDLITLIEEAQSRGAEYIELRQTCLGKCESGEGDAWRPITPELQRMADAFPDLPFNLAIAWPCLTVESNPRDEQFQAALHASKVVGRDRPHLRLVDPVSFESAWETIEQVPETAVSSMADLAREAATQGVILSIENLGQSIRSMALLIELARARLTSAEGEGLGLCPDPANQLPRYPDSDPLSELEALPPDMLKIVHFKQTREGKPHPTIDTGDVDCARQMRIMEARGYSGPAVMEIPPDDRALDNLSASFAFLRAVSGLAS